MRSVPRECVTLASDSPGDVLGLDRLDGSVPKPVASGLGARRRWSDTFGTDVDSGGLGAWRVEGPANELL